MKRVLMLLLLLVLPWSVQGQVPGPAQTGPRCLVAYFSLSGSTRKVATMIHDRVGGDLFEIKVVASYPADYEAVKARAKQEQASGLKPSLKARIKNIDSYDVIYLGYPIWWGELPMPVASFLSDYDFSGKTIAPFCTHQGSNLGGTLDGIANLSPRSKLLAGLAVWGPDAANAKNQVSEWLVKVRAASGK